MGIQETRDNFGVRVTAARYSNEHTIITKNGKPSAVLVSYEWYRAQQEQNEEAR